MRDTSEKAKQRLEAYLAQEPFRQSPPGRVLIKGMQLTGVDVRFPQRSQPWDFSRVALARKVIYEALVQIGTIPKSKLPYLVGRTAAFKAIDGEISREAKKLGRVLYEIATGKADPSAETTFQSGFDALAARLRRQKERDAARARAARQQNQGDLALHVKADELIAAIAEEAQ